MAGRGTRATATDYNNIQATVASVMGLGSTTTGYGQPITSTQVVPGAVITVAQWTTLRNDLSKARVHQTNAAVVDGLASISANRGSPWQTLQIVTGSTTISEDIRDQYNQFSSGIQSNKDVIAATGQSTSGIALTSSTRVTAWGTGATPTRTHTFTVTFAGYTSGSLTVPAADHARCFFNAGGQINITASRTGTAATTKDTDWTNMLSGFGTFSFKNSSCSVTGSINSPGSVSGTTGFSTLTVGAVSQTTVFTQASSVSVYAENRYTVGVRRPTANTIEFSVIFNDADTGDRPVPSPPAPFGPLVDESVTGTLTSTITCTRPSGSNVDVPAPTAATSVNIT